MPEPEAPRQRRTRTKLPVDESCKLILNKILKTAREDCNLDQDMASTKTGVPFSMLRRIERGSTRVPLEVAVYILGKYGYDIVLSIAPSSVVENPDLLSDAIER